MAQQDPVLDPQAVEVNENETLETVGDTTDQQPVVTPGASGAPNEQTPAGGDAPGGQPGEAVVTAAPDAEKKEKSDVQKRIDTLTRRRYELEGRNEELEYELGRAQRRLKAIEGGQTPQPAGTPPATPGTDSAKPVRESFATYEDWIDALTAHNAKAAAKAAIDEDKRENFNRQQAQAGQQVVAQWNTNLETAREKYDDFDAVVGTSLQIPQIAFNAIIDSPVGTDVAYYLGQHPDVAGQLAKMTPIGVVRTIGRIETQFTKEGAAVVPAAVTPAVTAPPASVPGASSAPARPSARPQATQRPKPITSAASAPVHPVGSRVAATKNPDEMSYQEYKAWREENGRPSR